MKPVRHSRGRRPIRAALLAGSLLAGQTLALRDGSAQTTAQERVTVRGGIHVGFSRVVFDWERGVDFRIDEAEGRVIIAFDRPADFDLSRFGRMPANIAGLSLAPRGMEISTMPGTTIRSMRVGTRVVLDVLAPGSPPNIGISAPQTSGPTPGASSTRGQNAPAQPAPASQAGATASSAPSSPGGSPPTASPLAGSSAATPTSPAEAGRPPPAPMPAEARPPAAQPPSMPPTAPRDVTTGAGLAAHVAPAGAQASVGRDAAPITPPSAPVRDGLARDVPRPTALPTPPRDTSAGTTIPMSIEVPGASAPVRDLVIARIVPPAVEGPAFALPVPDTVAAAAFRRGSSGLIVLDDAFTVDLSSLAAAHAFGGIETRRVVGATVIRLSLPEGATLRPRRVQGLGWIFEIASEAPGQTAIRAEYERSAAPRVVMGVSEAGRTVALQDPETGGVILAGTLRQPGQAVLVSRAAPEFQILPTFLGVAVVPLADEIILRSGRGQLVLTSTAASGLRIGSPSQGDGAGASRVMTKLFNFPDQPRERLIDRLREVLGTISNAPPLARAAPRAESAEIFLALGMPQEAQATALLGMSEDPRAASDLRMVSLHAVGALLAGRPAEARRIEDTRLGNSDEITLWRGLLAASRGQIGAAAPAISAAIPLILAYPEGLRARVLRPAAEALAEAGDVAGASALLSAVTDGDGALAYARARLLEAQGEAPQAIAAYDDIARGRDRLSRARAIRRATELRLTSGEIDAGAAASRLDDALYAWRGDGQEFATRLRIAELRRQAGDSRGAFDILSDTESLFPERATTIRAALTEAFLSAIETSSPAATATLFEQNGDLIPSGRRGEEALQTLAERLLQLDLPERAVSILQRAAERSADPAARAQIGMRMAAIRLGEGDPQGALSALEATAGSGLPNALASDRAIIEARARSRRGDRQRAIDILRDLGPVGALPLAGLLADAQDWNGAAAALAGHAAATIPPAPAELQPEHRRILTQIASYAALGGDNARLAAVRDEYGARMRQGALSDTFMLLVSDPIRGLADLPRISAEIEAFRRVSQGLQALGRP